MSKTLPAAALLIALGIAACSFFSGEPPPPTPAPDLAATIAAQAAQIRAATRPPLPTIELPSPTPVPPDLPATLLAAVNRADLPTVAPSATPVPEPTYTPAPTLPTFAPVLVPTTAPVPPTPILPTSPPTRPAPATPPCIVVGTVTITGQTAPIGTNVYARHAMPDGSVVAKTTTDERGRYFLEIRQFTPPLDLYVEDQDSEVDSSPCDKSGKRSISHLTIN